MLEYGRNIGAAAYGCFKLHRYDMRQGQKGHQRTCEVKQLLWTKTIRAMYANPAFNSCMKTAAWHT